MMIDNQNVSYFSKNLILKFIFSTKKLSYAIIIKKKDIHSSLKIQI